MNRILDMITMILKGLKGLQSNLHKKAIYKAELRKYGLNWFTQKKLKHQSKSVIHKHQFEDTIFYYKNGGDFLHLLKEIFLDGIYKADLSMKPYIIDGGANIGLSVAYFMINHPEAVVEAFEPDPQNFKLLKKNSEKWANNVYLHQAALWRENGTINFSDTGDMSSKIEENKEGTIVRAIRLKDLLNRKVSLLKLDIEGAEYDVLLDIVDSLQQVENLFVEYHGNLDETFKLTHILSMLEKVGFRYYIKSASDVHKHPFSRIPEKYTYDMQLNLFFFR